MRIRAFLKLPKELLIHALSVLPVLPGDPKPDAEIDVAPGCTAEYSAGFHIKRPDHCLFWLFRRAKNINSDQRNAPFSKLFSKCFDQLNLRCKELWVAEELCAYSSSVVSHPARSCGANLTVSLSFIIRINNEDLFINSLILNSSICKKVEYDEAAIQQ